MEPIRAGELHPLQNTRILEIIFECKRLTLKDLKSCRLVCREWRSVSGSAMCKFMPLVRICSKYGNRISDFLDLVKVEGAENAFLVPPFMKNFKIHYLGRDSRTFWEFCGRNIKILDLQGVTFESRDALRHAIFQACPNLEALTLCAIDVQGERKVEEPTEWVPPIFPPNHNLKSLGIYKLSGAVSYMEMLCQFPALEKVEQRYESAREFWRSLALARNHDPQCWKIKHFQFRISHISDQPAVLPVLEDRTLPLESLYVRNLDGCTSVWRRILIAHGATLKNLSLKSRFRMDMREGRIIPPPNNMVFQTMETLHVGIAALEWSSFLRSFPNLKRLKLSGIDPIKSAEGSFGNWTIDSCIQLELSMNGLEREDLRELFVRLPKLEKLKVFGCTNDNFAVICEFLPSLEHLDLPISLVDDVGFSGLDAEDVARINEAGEEGRWPLTEARPNLSRLQNLKSFRIGNTSRTPSVPDYTTGNCLQKLPRLQQLCIHETSAHPIWKCLHEQFPWRE